MYIFDWPHSILFVGVDFLLLIKFCCMPRTILSVLFFMVGGMQHYGCRLAGC